MIGIDGTPVRRYRHRAVETLPMGTGQRFWNHQSQKVFRRLACEPWPAHVAWTIIAALLVLAGLQLLGVFISPADWSVLRNVSGWVGPAAAVGAAGAAAAAASGGLPPNWDDGLPADPRHRHDLNPDGQYRYPPIKLGATDKFVIASGPVIDAAGDALDKVTAAIDHGTDAAIDALGLGGDGEGHLPDLDPALEHRHDKNPDGTYMYPPIKAGWMTYFSAGVQAACEFIAGPKDDGTRANAGGKA